jgi:hypothetical protein
MNIILEVVEICFHIFITCLNLLVRSYMSVFHFFRGNETDYDADVTGIDVKLISWDEPIKSYEKNEDSDKYL